jgi:membrane protein insertase Oxa1/YidC/SpoIIIJ
VLQVDFGLLVIVLSAFTTFSPLGLFNYYNSYKVVSIVQNASRFKLVEVEIGLVNLFRA